jgi:thiol:disulfide interchange protein DsbC
MIVFSPKGQVKASVTVFTDVDCGYCQKLHEEVPALNAKGIEVRYLAYPRAGIGSPSYNKIVSAWCANDQQDALTKLKRRQPIPTNICAGNPVAAQFALGGKMGVRGTPALVLESGRLLPGYMPADRLAAELGVN